MTSEYLLRKDSAEIHLGRDLLKKRRVCNGTTAKKVFNKIQHIMADEKVLLLFSGRETPCGRTTVNSWKYQFNGLVH